MARAFNATLGTASTDRIIASPANSYPGTVSLFAWVFFRVAPGAARIFDATPSGTNDLWAPGAATVAYIPAWTTTSGNFTYTQPSTGTWHAMGLSYLGSATTDVPTAYVDGASQSVTTGTAPVGTRKVGVSNWTWGNRDVDFVRCLDGALAHAAVWNAVLTAGEHAALAAGALPFTIRPTALVGYWPFDGLASPEPDLSGSKNNGTVTGAKLYPGAPASMFTPRRPMFIPGTAASFLPAWFQGSNLPIIGTGLH